MDAFKIIWKSIRTYYNELIPLVLMSVVSILVSFFIIPAPFALAGLWSVARRAGEGRSTEWRDFWDGIRRYGPRNALNALFVVFVTFLIVTNVWFYNQPDISPVSPKVAVWLTVFWLGVTLLWIAVLFYWLAFQLEMEEPKFWVSLRNSLFFALLNPIPTLVFLILSGLLAALAVVVPPLIFLYPGFIATLSTTAVKSLLVPILEQQEELEQASQEATMNVESAGNKGVRT